MPLFNQITIIGVGLIGGSLAKSIKKNKLCNKVVGFFRNKEKLYKATKEKIIDEGYIDLKKSIYKSDLIILALPVNQIINFMLRIKKIAKHNTIIMDVGSTKSKIIKTADNLNLNFVGTHPLAGSEKKGMNFSSNGLFKNSKVIISPTKKTNKESLSKIKLFWKKLNAQVLLLTAPEHDKILAFTSHLPHLVSFNLINSIPKKYLSFAASGLKDTTRIALSDAQIWSEIFLSNKKELLESLNIFQRHLEEIKKIIRNNKTKQLLQILNLAKNKREKLINAHK